MKEQKKSNNFKSMNKSYTTKKIKAQANGITLIALVISIIVMLILAGVSLNATIGENGIITKAQQAKEKYNIASLLEELEVMMVDFNLEEDVGVDALKEFMNLQIEKGKIKSFKTLITGNKMQCIMEKEGYLFYAVPEGNNWKVVYSEDGLEVGGIEMQVFNNQNASNDGKFELGTDGKETDVIFYEKIDGELNFDIYGTVNIYLYNDMNLTNSGLERSAIDIHKGAILNLYLNNDEEGNAVTVIANSGFGKEGETANGLGALGGPGGYAGIHVPWIDDNGNGERDVGEYGTLNVYGTGTIYAYGGDAGDGGGAVTDNTGGGRRRSVPVLE